MFLFCNLPAKVQSLYRNCPIRHHLLYFFYLITPILFADAGMRIHKAMLLHAKSNAFRCWEQCFQALGTMLSGAGSNALGVPKQCSRKPKAMPYGFQGNDISTRKACFQHPEAGLFAFSHLFSLGATGVELYLPPLWATTLARDSPPSEGPGEVVPPPYWGGLGWGFTSPPPSSH